MPGAIRTMAGTLGTGVPHAAGVLTGTHLGLGGIGAMRRGAAFTDLPSMATAA